jgi:crotonobetainyl-CoA:carnitine CoA-transferase CaiB-like acyl-CoA transferase
MLGLPVKLSETPGSVRTHPPRLGEHTERVLREDLGMNETEIDALSHRKIVRIASQTGGSRHL